MSHLGNIGAICLDSDLSDIGEAGCKKGHWILAQQHVIKVKIRFKIFVLVQSSISTQI